MIKYDTTLKTGEKEVEVFLEDTTNSHANEPELLINEDQAAEDNDSVMLRKAQKYVTISKSLEENQEFASDSKINLTDPDAKFMKRNGKISQSYNIQVTSSEGYILAADIAEANSENDLEQLAPTLWFNPLKLDSLFLILLDISPHIFEVSPILKLNVASSYYKDG